VKFSVIRLAFSALLLHCATCAAAGVTLDVNGLSRTAEVHAQPAAGGARALVIALHGLGQSVDSVVHGLGLDAAGTGGKFVAAYPQGMDGRWNYGRQINKSMPLVDGRTIDDIAFLRLLIARLIPAYDVDPARVYLLGVSNGALMAYRAACEMAGELAAVAAFISSMTDLQQEDCATGKPVPMLILAGSADEFQAYRGATAKLGRLVSVPDTFRFFRTRNGCRSFETEELPDLDPRDGTTVTVFRAGGCEGGAEVVFYRVNGGGHRIPTLAPVDTAPHPRFGLTNRDIDAAVEAWNFFTRFRSMAR
jgi:polyhydroxybutyrate depolymerase